MSTPVYEERQAVQFRWLVAAVIVGMLLVSGYLARGQQQEFTWIVLLSAALVAVMWLLLVFRIVVTDRELRFGYPFWRRRIPLENVRVGDVEKINVWAGIGIHFWQGKWVYNAHFGRGVVIRNGRTEYLVGSLEPEKFQNALLSLARRKGVV